MDQGGWGTQPPFFMAHSLNYFSDAIAMPRRASAASFMLKPADLAAVARYRAAYEASGGWRGDCFTGIGDVLRPYVEAYHAAAPHAQAQFVVSLLTAAKAQPDLAVMLLSFLFDLTKQPEHFYATARAVAARRGLAPHRHYNLFLHLSHLLMMNRTAFSVSDYAQARQKILRPLYARLFRKLQATLKHPLQPYRPNPKKILLITNMINNPRMTGPLWDTLEYAYELQTRFGYEPLVINSNIWLQAMGDPIWPLRCYGTPAGKERTLWPHRGVKLDLFRLWDPWPEPDALDRFCAMVMAEKPALAINIGDLNCYTDLLAQRIPCYTMHFTVDFPVTLHSRPTYHPGLPETTAAMRALAGYGADDKLVKLVPSYSVPGRFATYQRRDFDLNDNDFIYTVVGHRLDSEVTPEFLTRLEAIVTAAPHGFIVFLGLFQHYKDRVSLYPRLAARSAFIGNVGDVSSFMQIADCYLNPDRAGGGSSAVYAMAAGVPVLTLPHGDVAFACGPGLHCADYDAMVARAILFAQQSRLHGAARRRARARARQLCQRYVNMELILQDAGLFAQNRPKLQSPMPRRVA